MNRPLADELRPVSLEDVVGQEHILGNHGILRRVIEGGTVPNMIFYGPSGTGKTTVANIIAARTKRRFHRLNATTASIGDIKDVIGELDTLLAPGGVLLYLDEIQYFNKKQQQSLLEFMENGKITLIASTTENPYFYVYNALLSRATVFEFHPVTPAEISKVLKKAVSFLMKKWKRKITLEDGVSDYLSSACSGDVRKAITALELLYQAAPVGSSDVVLSMEDAVLVAQRSSMRYDKDGDDHYDILSAFQKSIRGSDPDAALHYLARLLDAGDLISPCRRLLVTAAEDIGLAYPQVLPIVKACVDMAHQLGLPEARIPLADAAILLSTAPKSNSGICAMDAALSDVRKGKSGEVPAHLKDAHYSGAQKLGRGLTYQYAHDFPNHYVKQQYLPDRLLGTTYYTFGENKIEQASRAYWDKVKKEEPEH
jgi:putative ATPase